MTRLIVLVAVVAFCTVVVAPTANAGLVVTGVGGNVNLVNPENADATVGLGVLLDTSIRGTQWGIESYAGYWKASQGAFGIETSVSDFAFGGRAKYNFLVTSSSVHPYIGSGLGLHFATYGITIADYYFAGTFIPGESIEDSQIKLGLDFGGGLTFDVGQRVSLIGDTWVHLISDLSHISARLGVMYRM